jgi:putative ABC transport system permease protein
MNPLPLVLGEIRNGLGSFLAVTLLIALAVALGVAVSAQERALRRGSAAAAAPFDLVVGAPGSPTQLVLTTVYLQPAALELVPGSVLRRLQDDPGIAYAAPIAFGDFYRGSPIVGTTVDFLTAGGTRKLAAGSAFARVHEAVVGAAVALTPGDSFEPVHGVAEEPGGDEHVHHGSHYVVTGRMPRLGTAWDHAILVPIEAMWRVHALPSGHAEASPPGADHDGEDHDEDAADAAIRIGPPWGGPVPGTPAILVKPKTVADAYRLRAAYRGGGTTALFPAEVLVQLYATLGDARDVLAGIAVATQALVVAAVLLAVLAVLGARRQQVAVLRALGASRLFVFACVWLNVMAMIVAGAVLGLLLGWLGAVLLAHLLELRTGLAVAISLGTDELAMVGALPALGCLLAALPGIVGNREPVADGLRL